MMKRLQWLAGLLTLLLMLGLCGGCADGKTDGDQLTRIRE